MLLLSFFKYGAYWLMVWCRAGVRGDFLSVYANFYEPLTLPNRLNRMHYTMCKRFVDLFFQFRFINFYPFFYTYFFH